MIGSSFLIRSLLPAPAPASAEATWLLSLPPKILATNWSPCCCVDLVDAHAAVEQTAGTLLGDSGLELARVDVFCLDVLLNAADKGGHQRLDGAVHFAFVGAQLVGDVCYRNLVDEVVEFGHRCTTFVAAIRGFTTTLVRITAA